MADCRHTQARGVAPKVQWCPDCGSIKEFQAGVGSYWIAPNLVMEHEETMDELKKYRLTE